MAKRVIQFFTFQAETVMGQVFIWSVRRKRFFAFFVQTGRRSFVDSFQFKVSKLLSINQGVIWDVIRKLFPDPRGYQFSQYLLFCLISFFMIDSSPVPFQVILDWRSWKIIGSMRILQSLVLMFLIIDTIPEIIKLFPQLSIQHLGIPSIPIL